MPERQSSKSIPLEIKIVHTRLEQGRAAFHKENTSREGRRSKPSDKDVKYNRDLHLQLRGQNPIGSHTATASKYVMQLCDSIPGYIKKRERRVARWEENKAFCQSEENKGEENKAFSQSQVCKTSETGSRKGTSIA